ncbi:hypothetical protein [Halofilum ochraceum]|uniref:hypothetical protein n=1 Tax=Halofilum ochraceum TaxID=1611323 RepID=UPI0008379D89|nr:hypothetical protein [Halofilum ochraceum]
MIRLCLIVLAWPLVVVALVSGYQWYRTAFPEPPEARFSGTTVDYPRARRVGREALEQFEQLAPAEQEAVLVTLARTVVSPQRWLRNLRRANYGVLCVGEIHEPDTRAFLAEFFFSRYPTDRLLLEVRPPELRRIHQQVAKGREYTPLLDADIGAVIRQARSANPDVRIHGIEETREQYRARQSAEGSRDRSLARNFWRHFRPGENHVVLYGALHCADEPGWLYGHLRAQAGERQAVSMRNIQVLGEYQFEPLAAFLYFLDHIGIAPGHFVIEDTARLHPLLGDWFGLLNQHVLSRYDALVVFHESPPESGGTIAVEQRNEAGSATAATRSAVHRVRQAVP